MRAKFRILLMMLCLLPVRLLAAPGDILFSDDFESGSLAANWSVATGSGNAAVSAATANSGTQSMYTRWGTVTVTSNVINAAVPAAQLTFWVRRGDDSFSEDPDNGEDLVIEYLDNTAAWVTLETFLGNGTPGQTYTRTYTLPAAALHAGLRLRVRQTGGSGSNWDYWHIDDVIVTEIAPPAVLTSLCDDFESGLIYWSISGSGSAGISGQTSLSPGNSLFLRWNTVTVTSNVVDFSAATSAEVSVWVRRGADSFSEDPDNGEDLVIEYLNNALNWVALETFAGNGTPGQAYTRLYSLPANALHAAFQLRFRQTGGSGPDWDYWHADDVCIQPPTPAVPQAYYQMDEAAWNGTANEVIDSSGNANHGTAVDSAVTAGASPAIPGDPGTCGYGEIPFNNAVATQDAVDTGVDMNSIGNVGTIDFWYKSNVRWNGNNGDRMLFDASNSAAGPAKYFFLVLRNNSRLRFALEDSNDGDFVLNSGNNNFNAGVWVHVAATWDLPNDTLQIYINGNLDASQTFGTNGVLGNMLSLYMGDNRGTYLVNGSSARSANGSIDEVRIYNTVLTQSQINIDMNATHPCNLLDHYSVSHDGSGISCLAETITITGRDAGDNPIDPGNITINLSTSTNLGTWSSVITGTGILTNLGAGAATYTFPGGENTVELAFNYTSPGSDPETVNFNVTDGTSSETSGAATAADDPDISFATSGFIFNNDSDGNQTITTQIAGKDSNLNPGSKVITLQAVRVSDNDPNQCTPLFISKTESVDIGAECRNPLTCAGRQLSINTTPISTSNDNGGAGAAGYTNFPALSFDASARATIVLNYPDAGQLQLHARHNILLADGTPSDNYMVGGSNDFVVRPFGIALTNVRQGATANPGGTAAAGAGFIAAEDTFQLDGTGYQYDPADDADVDGVPDIGSDITDNGNGTTPNFAWLTALSALTGSAFTPAGGAAGTLGGTINILQADYSNGTFNSAADLTYNEVGSVTLQAQATDYLFVGSGIDVLGYSAPVGRFYPDHFTLQAGSAVTAACGTFTYMDQNALTLSYTLQARGVNEGVPANYDSIAGYDTGVIYSVAEDSDDGTDLASRIPNTADWISGQHVLNLAPSTFLRLATGPDGPFDNLQLGIRFSIPADASYAADQEQDGRNIQNLNMKATTSGDCTLVPDCEAIAIGAATQVRYGRLNLVSNYGSELVDMNMQMSNEYFNGTQFVSNTLDVCATGITLGLSDPIPTDTLLTADTCVQENPAAANLSGIACAADGPLAEAYTEPPTAGSFNLWLQAPNKPGTLNIDSTSTPAWLLYDWNVDGIYDEDPNATATFGIFSGDDATIYRREVY